jgi:hypothetical protein
MVQCSEEAEKMFERTAAGRNLALLAITLMVGQSGSSVGQEKPHAVSPDYPGFSVSVTLSDKARKLLADHKETIIVAAYFTGSPKPGTPRKYVSDMGEIGLARISHKGDVD